MKYTSLKIAFLFASAALAQNQLVNFVDFENRSEGPYTNAHAKEDFPKAAGSSWYAMEQNGGQNATIVTDGEHGKVLRLKYPAGCVGPNDNDTPACAGQVSQPLSVTADTMWIAYDLKFEEGFEFVKGGKLPGLCGGECYTGGNRPSKGDGWSGRIMWRADGKVVQYMYFVDQAGTYGDDMLWDLDGKISQKKFEPGKWHHLVTKISLNTVTTEGEGDKNGRIQSWFDGELSLDVDTLRLRDFAAQKIDRFYISTFHGGSATDWAPSQDVFARFDNFTVALDSIPVTTSANPEGPNQNDSTTAIRSFPQESLDSKSLSERGISNRADGKSFINIYNANGVFQQRKILPQGTSIQTSGKGKSVKIVR